MRRRLGIGYGRLLTVTFAALLSGVTAGACNGGGSDEGGDGGAAGSGTGGRSSGGSAPIGGTSSGGGNAGDSGLGGGGQNGTLVTVNEPADLVSESEDDYDDNESGIVSGATVEGWIGDWEANRPAGIEGRLIILQQDSKDGATVYIAHDDENVFTYRFHAYAYADSQLRNNGLLDTFATIPDGEHTDDILNEFGIDLTKDLVLFAFADASSVPGTLANDPAVDNPARATKVWYNTRSWWWLRYWGAAAEHLAILNGAAAEVLDDDYITDAPSDLPEEPGSFSVKELLDDNTSLKVDVGELIDLVKDGDEIVLVDPRRTAEYTGTVFASPNNPVNAKRPLAEGRIKGARFLPWQATLEGVTIGASPTFGTDVTAAVNDNGLRFKSKADLLALYNDDDYVNYDEAAEGTVTVHYCGHGRRASTWAFISQAVLGVPARLYDGSWVEWGNLVGESGEGGAASYEDAPLPSNSRWRIDTAELSEYGAIGSTPTPGVQYNPETGEVSGAPVAASAVGLNINPDAEHTDAIVATDRAYKTGN